MITELTKEQEARFPEFVNKWVEIGLDTKRTTVDELRPLIDRVYENANLKPPRLILLVQSPHEALITAEMIKDKEEAAKKQPDYNNIAYGNQETWLSFYDYFLIVCNLECCEKLRPLIELASYAHWWLPYSNVAIVSQKPLAIHRDEEHRLHRDGGPALHYADGFALYRLHGVVVPEYLAVTPGEKLDLDFFLKEKNVEVRREFVRKFGIERLEKHGEIVDKKEEHNYKLIDFGKFLPENGGGKRYAPYLFMDNPSIPGIRHGEGVHPDCKSVNQAIAWRNQTDEKPEKIT